MTIEELSAAHDAAVARMREAADAIDALDDAAGDEAITEAETSFEEAEAEVLRCRRNLDRAERVARAREEHQPLLPPADAPEGRTPVTPRGGEVEQVYRPDVRFSFFRDMINALADPQARERLDRHQQIMLESRDVSSGDPGATGFIPPIYLGERWAELPRAGRQFADQVPTWPFPDTGLTIDVPKVQTGVTEAVQAAEGDAVSETDIDTQTVSASLVTIAGQNDIQRQALERSFPGMDVVIFHDLMRAHDAQLDTQLLAGSGSNGQHLGIRNVTSNIDVTYTDGTPTGAELLKKIYDAIQQVATNRYEQANLIVMHPRRAAWLASELSSTFPLFQQGALTQAVGEQNRGFAGTIAGLPVVLDANIGTTYGASTNEDEIYVLHVDDLGLAEGPVREATYEDVGSGTLTVRLQLFSYSFFVPHRQPKSIAIIGGTGLVAPTF